MAAALPRYDGSRGGDGGGGGGGGGGDNGRGVRFARDAMGVIDHIALRHKPGSHKLPSMRQDIENGVPTERGVIIEAIQEMGVVVGVPTPTIDVIVPLLRELEETSLQQQR